MLYTDVKVEKDKMSLRQKDKEIVIPWGMLTLIYPSRFTKEPMDFYTIFNVETQDNNRYVFQYSENDRKRFLEKLFDFWEAGISKENVKVENMKFFHSKRWIQKKRKQFYLAATGVLIVSMPLICLLGLQGGLLARFFLLFYLLLYISLFTAQWFTLKKHDGILSLEISEEGIYWTAQDNQKYTKKIGEIKRFTLDKINGKIEFDDSLKLLKLESISYWPILRKQLMLSVDKEKHS